MPPNNQLEARRVLCVGIAHKKYEERMIIFDTGKRSAEDF